MRHLRTVVPAVLALVLVASAPAAAAQAALPSSVVPVTVGASPDSRPVPSGFLGLSIEYSSALYYFGTDPAAINPLFVTLLRQLTPGQAPVIRFGGDTTDWTWWPTPGVAQPPGIRYALGSEWVDVVHAAAQALGARLILGINLEADNAAIARTESEELLNGLGSSIAGFELGNEPEVYGTLGWYATPKGVEVPGRAASYDFGAYLSDFARISTALPRSVPLVGPASGASQWISGLARYLRRNPRVRIVTYHRYPLDRCFTAPSSPSYPTLGHLLAPASSAGLADSLIPALRVAHARGLTLRADELNSVSCGGKLGVSDTFASSLWVLDTLLNMAAVGVDGVNIHTFRNAWYEPFAFTETDGVWTAQVKPLYYGLLMFAQAAPAGARLLPVVVPARATFDAWATRDPSGTVRVVLINDAVHRWVTAAVRPPVPAGTATAQTLRAPRLGATSGVTLGGQSFGATTSTGTLTGPQVSQSLTAAGGRFLVRLPPASATLVTVGG